MIDEDVQDFIRSSIRSVWALEVLLLLRREHGRAWTAGALAHELRANERLVSDVLATFATSGLVSCGDTCSYAPVSPALDDLCARLEATYRERPVAVVKAIMAAPNDKLQIFADAFRFRNDDVGNDQ